MARSHESEFGGAPLPQLLCDEAELDAKEALNGIILAVYASDLAREWQGEYRFTPDIIRTCNRIAMDGIYACGGEFRTRFVTAGDFVAVPHREIPRLVDEMCLYVNSQTDVYHAAAYMLWRTSWIHPFYDGNGRVSRELSYLALVVGLGLSELEGTYPIPNLLKREEERYLRCLRIADTTRTTNDEPNLGPLVSLLCELSDEQLTT